jgi:hypothetical protein
MKKKKRPLLISFTSFEDEFGLKPPRSMGDYDRELSLVEAESRRTSEGEGRGGEGVEEGEVEGKEEGRKERKWWHLSG